MAATAIDRANSTQAIPVRAVQDTLRKQGAALTVDDCHALAKVSC
jgi:hypothetical protein